ncbi:MAG: hypothetical protein JWO95_2900 [Verrucomicrobiales bacterium]|nr:hypothetical protein [Verrucomicrobiales bacterium]
MHTQTNDALIEKTRELCETILKQPEFQAIRENMDKFMINTEAQKMYQELSEKGQYLQHKQEQGLQLETTEVEAFEKQREKFFSNPVAKNFVDAQQQMHEMQDQVNQYLTKTFELGRMPEAKDFEGGSCGSGCGCH